VIGLTRRLIGCPLLAAIAVGATTANAEPCQIQLFNDIPVTMSGLRPMVRTQINGQDASLIADSGAFFSTLTPAAAQQFQLPYKFFPGLFVEGVGGSESARVARVKKFTLMGLGHTWNDVDFVVAGSSFGGEAAGLLGQNVFRIADVEYDLANGVIRLVRPKGDCKRTSLAYWASAAQKPYSVIDIEPADVRLPHTKSVAYLNGVKIRVMFDTGAEQSLLTLGAAKRAGIAPSSAGVTDGGYSYGLGHKVTRTWITRFSSFKIGDEEVQHAELRFGDIELTDADMLIGADFFLSHRIYVASSQKRLYFTYNGGPVFDLTAARAPAESPAAGAGPEAAAAAEAPATANAALRLDQPTDAAGYARRGTASAARHDYAAAIADLTHACELAPTEAVYFYQRGQARVDNKQPDLALADFAQAIKLKPDDTDALIARATLRADRGDSPDLIVTDLDAADRAVPREADAHLDMGELYAYAGQPAAAVAQYSKWIDARPRDDLRMAGALNSRCWARALGGQELDKALADCNTALKLKPNTADFLDSRGLVYLRQGNYDKAIADYDAALLLAPKMAWSLYGRGVAKSRKGLSAEGQADIAAATALQPKIAERAASFGITR
jgi:tetratricopeptide (TPR) repeat protein